MRREGSDVDTQTVDQCDEVELPPPAVGVVVVFSEIPGVSGAVQISRLRTAGRDHGLPIPLMETGVSRVHADFEPGDGGVLVTDRDSHNGTFVKGERVRAPKHPAPIGTTVRLGRTLAVPDLLSSIHRRFTDPWIPDRRNASPSSSRYWRRYPRAQAVHKEPDLDRRMHPHRDRRSVRRAGRRPTPAYSAKAHVQGSTVLACSS